MFLILYLDRPLLQEHTINLVYYDKILIRKYHKKSNKSQGLKQPNKFQYTPFISAVLIRDPRYSFAKLNFGSQKRPYPKSAVGVSVTYGRDPS
jgi:hypothetical protein